ncbi:MAG: hypothetical protein ACREUF_11105, partial [Solimonas sp.]
DACRARVRAQSDAAAQCDGGRLAALSVAGLSTNWRRPTVSGHGPACAHGHDRETVLGALTREAASALCLRDGHATGYAFRRPFGRGSAIGPVIADDEETAIALVDSLVSSRAGEFLRIDVPIGADGLIRLLEGSGLLPAGDVTTMIRGRRKRPSGRAKAFALVNQAIG